MNENNKLGVIIFYLKALFDKEHFKEFHKELIEMFEQYKNEFKTVSFSDVLTLMGINITDLQNLS